MERRSGEKVVTQENYLNEPETKKTLETQIDQLAYKLYDLTPGEIQIVEGFNKGK